MQIQNVRRRHQRLSTELAGIGVSEADATGSRDTRLARIRELTGQGRLDDILRRRSTLAEVPA